MSRAEVTEQSASLAQGVSPRNRLAVTFVGLFLILVVGFSLIAATFWRYYQNIESATTEFRDTIMPTTAAAYNLEINLLGSALLVLKYLNQPQLDYRERFEDDSEKLRSSLMEYRTFAKTSRERALNNVMIDLHGAFVTQARDLMAVKNSIVANAMHLRVLQGRITQTFERDVHRYDWQSEKLAESYRIIDLIDHEMDEMIVELMTHDTANLEVNLDKTSDMASRINGLFKELEVLLPVAIYGQMMQDMRSITDDMTNTVKQIIRLNHQIAPGLGFLIDLRQHMGAILEDGILEFAGQRLMANVMATKQAIERAHLILTLALILILLVAIAFGMVFVRQILRPIARLTRNVEAYGRGESIVQPPVAQNDEIGFLAEQFSVMTKRLTSSQESLSEANANLEEKIAARTAEVSEANRNLIVELERRTQIEERMMHATEVAIRASQAKSVFLAGMSHELRTPMNAILGFSDVMVKEVFGPLGNERYKEYISDIQNSGKYLLQLIDDLLMLGAIDENRLQLNESLCDPDEITHEVLQLVSAQAAAAQIEIRCRSAAGTGLLHADRRLVKQILINLVVNAVKFTNPGGKILIRWRMRNGETEMSVIDTGVGIPSDGVETLFNRYQRGDQSVTKDKQGVGLGLSLVKGMVEAHGAQISVRSRIDRGTEMTVHFPVSRGRPRNAQIEQAIAS